MGIFDSLFGGSSNTKPSSNKYAEVEAEHPMRAGKEHLGCYGAFFIDPQPARTLQMSGSIDGLKKYDLERSWSIVDQKSAKETLSSLANLNATKDIDLSDIFTADIYEAYAKHEASGKKFGGSDDIMQAFQKLMTGMIKYTPNNELNAAWGALTKKEIRATSTEILSVTNVSAWDIERLAGLARKCFYAGYITEDECYEYLEKASELTKKAYQNWRQYVIGYFLGRAICYSADNLGQWQVTADNLLNNPGSIWNQYQIS